MRQHRDALARCKATIQLAEDMTREHEAGYRAALASLNEASIVAFADRLANRAAKIAGNRMVGAVAVAARISGREWMRRWACWGARWPMP
jgi:hypothetical protein